VELWSGKLFDYLVQHGRLHTEELVVSGEKAIFNLLFISAQLTTYRRIGRQIKSFKASYQSWLGVRFEQAMRTLCSSHYLCDCTGSNWICFHTTLLRI